MRWCGMIKTETMVRLLLSALVLFFLLLMGVPLLMLHRDRAVLDAAIVRLERSYPPQVWPCVDRGLNHDCTFVR